VKTMGSSGKKKTTMAKRARENLLRERRLNKQAKKEARRQASSDRSQLGEGAPEDAMAQVVGDDPLADGDMRDPSAEPAARPDSTDEPAGAAGGVEREPPDPRDKEVALMRLRDAPDEELAVFERKLRDDALELGASEGEMREAQRDHPGHGA
jgi:hypothetical protein